MNPVGGPVELPCSETSSSRPPTRDDAPCYHIVRFAERREAAAFLAALSRFLASPEGLQFRLPQAPAEVWADPIGYPSVQLYLTEGALMAARTAFAPVPVAGTCPGGALPTPVRRMLEAGSTPGWGLTEAEELLSP